MSSTSGAGSFRAVLAIPHAATTFGSALLGRLSYGLLPLSMLFTVQQATNSFTFAGAVLACFGLTSLLLPLKARIVDRHGQARVLPALSVGASGAMVVMAVLAWSGTRAPAVYLLLGIAAGLCAPPLGPAMRAIWRIITNGTDYIEQAYSIDSVCEEALYLVGPLLVGLILSLGSAPIALVTTAALMLVGTLAMTATPPVRRTRVTVSGEPERWGLGPLRYPGFRRVALTVLVVAIGTGIATTAVAARSQAHDMPSAAGYIEAALAVGSVLGGLAWGRRRHTRSTSTHLAGLTMLLAIGIAIAAVTGNLILLGVVMAATGLAVAPLFIVSYLASDELAPEHQRTEASTWVNTANNIGAAVGASLAGALVDHVNIAVAFGTGAVLLALAAAVVWCGRRWLDNVANRGTGEDTVASPQ